MLYYNIFDEIDVFEGIDVNKTSTCKECITCHYWYFLDKGFKFQPAFCNGCHDVLLMSIDLNSIAILNTHGLDYHCIINEIRKSKAINLFKNNYLSQKSGTL